MSLIIRTPGEGSRWVHDPSVQITSAPYREYVDPEIDATDRATRRPVGFTAHLLQAEPLLWDGDQA